MRTEMKSAREKVIGNYLVLAHQTAATDALLEKLREIARRDRDATFTVLVPAKPVANLLTWTEGESIAEAQRTAMEVQRLFERSGLQVEEAVVGDASPVQAIADTIARRGPFDAIVISTPAPGLSRWLKLDVCARARERFRLPLISVVAGREALAAA
jgi:nucleotide-binding universal stress UspA family protein